MDWQLEDPSLPHLHPHITSILTAIALLWIPFKESFCKSVLASQACPVGPDCSHLNKDLTSALYGRRIIEFQGVSIFWLQFLTP